MTTDNANQGTTGGADITFPSLAILLVTPAEGYRVSARHLFDGLDSLASKAPNNLMARALLAGFVVEAALNWDVCDRPSSTLSRPSLCVKADTERLVHVGRETRSPFGIKCRGVARSSVAT